MIRILQRIYLALFIADAALTLFTLFLPRPLVALNWLLALLVSFLGMLIWLALIVTPRFSPWLLIPVLFTLWANLCYAFPLNMLAVRDVGARLVTQQFALAGLQLAMGIIWLGCLWDSRRQKWNLFSWRHSLVLGCASLVLAMLLLTAMIGGNVVQFVSSISGHYARLTFDGLYLKEKTFSRGQQSIQLAGMVHIGNDQFYQQFVDSLPKDRPALVLLEGVTNRKKEELSLDYKNVASKLGVSYQSDSALEQKAEEYLAAEENDETDSLENPQLRFVRADLDLADFHPETVNFLKQVGKVYDSRNRQEFLSNYLDMIKNYGAHTQKRVLEDIFIRRNQHLLQEIDGSDSPLIIVPWGAMHMAYLEAQLRQRGYVEVSQSESRAIAFGK